MFFNNRGSASLGCTFLLESELFAWLDLTSCAFSLRPFHWFHYTSCPTFSQCNVISKVLQFWWTICLDNSSVNCYEHLFQKLLLQSYKLQSPCLSLLQETLHLRGLIYLFCCEWWDYHFFVFFNFFLPVLYWCSYKGIFRIIFPKFLQRRFCSMHQSVFANPIFNAFWNWGVTILSRLSVWFYLVTNDRYFCLINTTRSRGYKRWRKI